MRLISSDSERNIKMRIYKDFNEAIPEIKRDVVEMGIKCHPLSYQDKDISNNPDFETLELQNYIYTVVNPSKDDLIPSQPWANYEFAERILGIDGMPRNPGIAWERRRKVWTEFLDDDGLFSYTYSERLSQFCQVRRIVDRIIKDPDSRQLFISVWNPSDIKNLGGISRVPCTLGYQIQIRKKELNITYLQRSCDLITHFINDVYLAHRLQSYLANETGYQSGTYTHWIGSLHLFKKDGEGVF